MMAWPEIKLENSRVKGKSVQLRIHLNITFALLLGAKLSGAFAQTFAPSDFKTISLNGAAGSLEKTNDALMLKSSAIGGGIFFAHQPFVGNGQIIARIHRAAGSPAKVGVLFRQSLATNALSAGTFLSGSDTVFERQTKLNEAATRTIRANEVSSWLRIVREGDSFSGFISNDGTNWNQFSADTIVLPAEIFAGIALLGKGEATIEQVQMTSARLSSPSSRMDLLAPTNIFFKADLNTFGGKPAQLDFFAESQKILTLSNAPYQFTWTNVLGGQRTFTAKITDATGNSFFAEPINVKVKLPPAQAKFLRTDTVTKGNWKGVYGKEGFLVVNDQTNLPPYMKLDANGCKSYVWESSVADERALSRTSDVIRIASCWTNPRGMTLDLSISDGGSHQVALYFLDWDDLGRLTKIQIWSADDKKILDTQTVNSFSKGKYFVWSLSGRVLVTMRTLNENNLAVSGLFLDSVKH